MKRWHKSWHEHIQNEKKPLNKGFNQQMASTVGFEPTTARLEGVCSIQLSYVDISTPNNNSKYFFRFQLLFYFFQNSYESYLQNIKKSYIERRLFKSRLSF